MTVFAAANPHEEHTMSTSHTPDTNYFDPEATFRRDACNARMSDTAYSRLDCISTHKTLDAHTILHTLLTLEPKTQLKNTKRHIRARFPDGSTLTIRKPKHQPPYPTSIPAKVTLT